jgi:poly(A) polymerase
MESLSVANADWFMKPETQAVFACLNREGFEARVVGGAVRNALLNQPVAEVDFATTSPPEDTLRLAHAAGLKTAPTGIAHGTVTIIVKGTPFEATTLRQDVKTDGRWATVAFGKDWAEDARRRDFTMNALYADAVGEVHDPLGGLPDLFARRVRFVGDPDARIREDYLRILRFFRFSAQYGEGAFDRDGVAASIRQRLGLTRLSRERIRAELLRILVARRAADAIEVLDESGLLLLILGGVALRRGFERLCVIEAALSLRPDPIYRLAALGLFVAEDAARLSEKLRLSAQEANDLAGLSTTRPFACALDRGRSPSPCPSPTQARLGELAALECPHSPANADWRGDAVSTAAAELPLPGGEGGGEGRFPGQSGFLEENALLAALYRLGPRIFLGRLLLSWAASEAAAGDPAWKRAAGLALSWRRPKFPVKGGDLVAQGLAPGAAVGERLRRLEETWIASRFTLTREALLQLCNE